VAVFGGFATRDLFPQKRAKIQLQHLYSISTILNLLKQLKLEKKSENPKRKWDQMKKRIKEKRFIKN